MSFISKILYSWHYIRMNYHLALVESCIDDTLSNELKNKFEYHKKKAKRLKK